MTEPKKGEERFFSDDDNRDEADAARGGNDTSADEGERKERSPLGRTPLPPD